MKACVTCGVILRKRPKEGFEGFGKRKSCSTKCAGLFRSGVNNKNWKGGFPKCGVCNKPLTSYLSKNCVKHKKMPESFSAKMKGRPAWNKGKSCPFARKNPQVFKKGMIPWNKGLTKSDPRIRSGERINTWKGGTTQIATYLRKTDKYKEWRNNIFVRDSFTCQICGGKGVEINADHIIPLSFLIKKHFIVDIDTAYNCVEIWDINNGRTLCVFCHRKTDTWGHGASKFT